MTNPGAILQESNINKLRLLRWKARTDLIWFCNNVMGYPDVTRKLHGSLIDRMQHFPKPTEKQLVENDQYINGGWVYKPIQPDLMQLEGLRRLLILDGRGLLKSSINCDAHTIQWIINYPDIAIAILQANIAKAEKVIFSIKNQFTRNPIFRELFPEHCPPPKKANDWGTAAEFTTEARSRTCTRKESTVIGASIEKGLAGSHFDIIKYSDIVDETNCLTEQSNRTIFDKFVLSQNLLVSPLYWIDVEGTRYDEQDTYGRILASEQLQPKKTWKTFVRGVFEKDTKGKPRTYTEDELDLPDLLDANGSPISIWPERHPVEGIMSEFVLSPYITSCTPGWGPILMSDWSEKPISEVKVGDSVIGFETETPIPRKLCHLIPSKVLAVGSEKGIVYKYTTDKGNTLYSTADHFWFTGRKRSEGEMYKNPVPGVKVSRVYQPLPNNDPLLWSYLGGLLDGEGHFSKGGSNITICQSLTKNGPICAKIEDTLSKLGIGFNPYPRTVIQNGEEARTILYDLQGGRNLRMSILLNCPHLAKRSQLQKQMWKLAHRVGHQDKSKERIVSQEVIGEMDVFWLQTTSGNYVSQGYASKNCQKFNKPNRAIGGQTIFPTKKDGELELPLHTISRKDFRERVWVSHWEITVDTAETDHTRSNCSVITVGAWDQAGRLYVAEIRRGKWLAAELIVRLIATWQQTKLLSRNGYVKVRIEETGYVRGLMFGLQQYLQQRQLYMDVQPFKINNQKSKAENITNSLQLPYKTGNMIFLDDLTEMAMLLSELKKFPAGATDDILDTLAAFYKDKEWLGRLQQRPETRPFEQPINLDRTEKMRQKAFEIALGFQPDFENQTGGPAYDTNHPLTGGL